jgi:hypothetical protein
MIDRPLSAIARALISRTATAWSTQPRSDPPDRGREPPTWDDTQPTWFIGLPTPVADGAQNPCSS